MDLIIILPYTITYNFFLHAKLNETTDARFEISRFYKEHMCILSNISYLHIISYQYLRNRSVCYEKNKLLNK